MKVVARSFVALLALAGASKAAVQEYDLTYFYTLEVADAWIDSSDQWEIDYYTPRLPEIGLAWSGSFVMHLRFDDFGNPYCETSISTSSYCELRGFDFITGDVGFRLSSYYFVDEWTFQDGSGHRSYVDDGPGLGYWNVEYSISDYSVSGLPEIAQAPVPPAAPMLAAGLLLMAGVRRFRCNRPRPVLPMHSRE